MLKLSQFDDSLIEQSLSNYIRNELLFVQKIQNIRPQSVELEVFQNLIMAVVTDERECLDILELVYHANMIGNGQKQFTNFIEWICEEQTKNFFLQVILNQKYKLKQQEDNQQNRETIQSLYQQLNENIQVQNEPILQKMIEEICQPEHNQRIVNNKQCLDFSQQKQYSHQDSNSIYVFNQNAQDFDSFFAEPEVEMLNYQQKYNNINENNNSEEGQIFQRESQEKQRKMSLQQQSQTRNIVADLEIPTLQISATQSHQQETQHFGHLLYGDKICRIVNIFVHNEQYYVQIKWQIRKDGFQPLDSTLPTAAVKQCSPQQLIQFYSSL